MEAELAAGLPKAARAHVAEVDGEDPDPEWDHLLAWLARSEGRFVVADDLLRQAEAALDAHPEPHVTTWRQRRGAVALERALLALARMAGSDAQAHGARAVELAEGSPSHQRAKAVLAGALALDGETARALALLDPAAPAIVDVHELAVRGVVRLWSDDCTGAYEDLATAVRRTEAGEALQVIQARSHLAETCLRMGRLDEVRHHAETACEIADESARPWQTAIDHTKAGWIAAVASDLEGARSHRDAIGALAAHMPSPSPRGLGASGTTTTFARLRVSAAASSWVAMVLALVEGDDRALLAAAEITDDLLQRADPGIVPLGPVRAEVLVGLALLDEAPECLDAYEERASRLGGDGGRRPLTPSERRVAALAAEGLSNPEIAEALSVTRKAVEYHRSNVFAKLGVGNR